MTSVEETDEVCGTILNDFVVVGDDDCFNCCLWVDDEGDGGSVSAAEYVSSILREG